MFLKPTSAVAPALSSCLRHGLPGLPFPGHSPKGTTVLPLSVLSFFASTGPIYSFGVFPVSSSSKEPQEVRFPGRPLRPES